MTEVKVLYTVVKSGGRNDDGTRFGKNGEDPKPLSKEDRRNKEDSEE